MRQKIVAGNWKMNKSIQQGKSLVSEIVHIVKDEVLDKEVKIIIAPPYTHLYPTCQQIESFQPIFLGAQNCASFDQGAYTGEVSAEMLSSVNVSYVIVGHSERRTLFQETNALLAKKVTHVLAHRMKPIFCCGESLTQRESNTHFDFIKQQLEESLFFLSSEQFKQVVIAYEPIWAIGTGQTATTEQAQEIHAFIRQLVKEKYGEAIAEDLTILYGGSCKPINAKALFACKDVDGGLIGGAALQARDFVEIVKSF